jgi:GTP:adenosylcobinamide-phosphate guanylyltransferase
MSLGIDLQRLSDTVVLRRDAILNPDVAANIRWTPATAVLIVLAAGKGTRFGREPKCIQSVCGVPLARHSINAFRSLSSAPAICLVGYQADHVATALGADNVYVRSSDPAGGTALAAYEAFAVDSLETVNPIVVVTMGDRIVPASVFRQLVAKHSEQFEADLTMLTADYQQPRNHGKGRIVRDRKGAIQRIVEQRDIDLLCRGIERDHLLQQTEGNCPLYAIRGATLKRYLAQINNRNAQRQFYFTDIVAAIYRDGGSVRSITLSPDDDRYELLCADVTQRDDVVKLERVLRNSLSCRQANDQQRPHPDVMNQSRTNREIGLSELATSIAVGRPRGQIQSIAAQLRELLRHAAAADHGYRPELPVSIGISGGRLRIAIMHPDMERFCGPAWQMPIGAAQSSGREQIVVLIQSRSDDQIRLAPTNPSLRESSDSIYAVGDFMFPGAAIVDFHGYEAFGTRMAETILVQLGYRSDAEQPSSDPIDESAASVARLVGNNLRRPFSLLANALASIRTVREGELGNRIQQVLGQATFHGISVVSSGDIPCGGFSSSSAFTVATLNAINALFELGIDGDRLVSLACQSEYGTGVRAGALDQATVQKGIASQGALISSNPHENYRIIKTFPVPTDRYRMLFPYSVDRDREAWRWSMGCYARSRSEPQLTAAETRKLTGKAAEIAAILIGLPLDRTFFQELEHDLVEQGELSPSTALHVQDRLRSVPLCVSRSELGRLLGDRQSWYAHQLITHRGLSSSAAQELAHTTVESLLDGWRDPRTARYVAGEMILQTGVPLRAMLGYLYAEVVKNCYLIHHPESWIQCVGQSQRGDRCFDLEIHSLPDKQTMLRAQAWETSATKWDLMERWLERSHAKPFDYNAGLTDAELTSDSPLDLRHVRGTNFFRGLALIDLAEAMLIRAFGSDAVAVRVNGAGQGDYFQVHVDTKLADPLDVKEFLRIAFYRRFSLQPKHEFVEPHPGGGAVAVRLDRYDQLPLLIDRLDQLS